MAESDEGQEQDAAARLEAALERIARAAARQAPADTEARGAQSERMVAMAGRLDALIAELREVLGPEDASGDALETGADAEPGEAPHTATPDPHPPSEPDLADPN